MRWGRDDSLGDVECDFKGDVRGGRADEGDVIDALEVGHPRPWTLSPNPNSET